jgi:membrane-bound acyltransferase YfiQ involved in biofilm formation
MVDPGIHSIISILIICCALYLLVYLGRHFLEKTIVYNWATIVSNTSFEIYLFHQFIINALLVVAMQMKYNLYTVPVLSLILNVLVFPVLILLKNSTVYWIKTTICQNR